MDAHELARWTRFAAKGGIGKCTAVVDCIAQEMGEDLMFLKDDEITVLMQLPDAGVYLGHCEGVVGRFSGKDVRFHGKLKKPVMAKRGSVTATTGASESRVSITLVDGNVSRTEPNRGRSRHTSESPSNSRPGSRAKRTPSPAYSKSHVPMQSYATAYSHYSEDQSPAAHPDSGDTTVVNTPHTSMPSTKPGHAKPPPMATSVSGASIFSVGSASIYSEASTATSVYSAAQAAFDRPSSRSGSIRSAASDETERDVPGDPEYGSVDKSNDVSNSHKLASPSASTPTPNAMLSASTSTSTSISTSTSTSGTSFASTSTYGSDPVHDSFGSVGSISDLETKQFDLNKLRAETQTGFVLVPPPLEIGGKKNARASPVVAPLRVSKSPRLTPSPGLPPSSPLPVPPGAPGENPRSTSVSPALPSPLSPGIPVSPSSRPSPSPSLAIPGSLSPGLPSSLSPGPRSPGLPGSLSPGFRSPGFLHGPNAQSLYTFSSGSGPNSPNPYPSPSLTNPYTSPKSNANDSSVLRTPHARSPSSPYGAGHPLSAPLSPPPTSPLPPLPPAAAASPSPSPAFPPTAPPTPGALPTMGTAATAAASGRTSPLTALSSSLPSSTSGTLYPGDRHGRRDGDETEKGRERGRVDVNGAWGEVEEGDTTQLSTLDEFRRRFDDSAELDGDDSSLEGEGEGGHPVGEKDGERGTSANEGGKGRKDRADVNSDGEIGIGLSLMGALGSEGDEDEDWEDHVEPTREIRGENGSSELPGAGDAVGLGIDKNATGASDEKGGTTPIVWTRYTPSSPVDAQEPNEQHQTGEEEGEDGEEEEEEEDGAYWDDIYDDYRYSRYSLASKRFSAASKHVSITSRASGASKTSSKSRVHAPPVPVPPDRPSFDAPRPSIGSDGTNGYPRPSFESSSSSISASMPFSRPSLTRSASDESTHRNNMLPLTAQFPAVPVHVPVRTESRLRIVHDGYMQGDDHGEREMQVEHGSTEDDTSEVGLNIEVVEVMQEGDLKSQEVDVGRQLTPSNPNMSLSPLLHTTFGSPHSSRFTDFEDGSDQDYRHSNKSGKSMMLSVEGPPKSPIEGGGMASALRATMEAERASSSGTASTHLMPTPTIDASLTKEPGVRAIVVDDEEGNAPDINITIDPVLETEAVSSLSLPTSNVAQATVPTDSTQGLTSPDRPEDAEKSSFLRPRPPPNQSPHPFARTSIFLPHPNAPKAIHQSQGPMYGRASTQTYAYPMAPGPGRGNAPTHQPMPPGTTFFSTHILHQLRSLSAAVSQGPARRPPMTLFARCQPDLSTSMGPVPILFSLDPFPPLPTPPAGPQIKIGGGRGMPYLENATPMRAATVSAPVRRGAMGNGVPLHEGVPVAGDASVLRPPKRSMTAVTSVGSPQGFDVTPASPSLPIPREGFVPQVGATRPRSRSFSEFGAHPPAATSQERSREEPAMKIQGVASVSAPQRKTSLPPALMPRHALPPLVVYSMNKDRVPEGSPMSPIAQSPLGTQVLNLNGPLNSPMMSSPLTSSSEKDKDTSPLSALSSVTSRTSVSSDHHSTASPHSLMPRLQDSLDAPRNSSVEGPPRRSSESSDSHSLTSPPPIPEAVSQNARSSPLAHELTLKTKLSLPALRMKASIRSKVDDAVSVASFPASSENETVQVQDMDFELVKPSLPQLTGRASQDSTLTSREVADSAKSDVSPVPCDAASTLSHAPRSPLVPTAPTEPAESIDAHRQRELKWMSLFPTVPPSQARKNKKVRKLLQEGVPSSVRYLVWCHLTDSKARALPGVYAKLGKRPRVPVFAEIEKDAAAGFPDQPQLHTAKGPLVSLLQAYLIMVPDIQYSSGLTSIAGHLLLLAPEEDAFWIFASMMDAHLRTYFATNNVHIEIDASLFSKALETTDPVLTKKLYVQLSIAPASITRPWFSTLFVGSLPVDHLHRVWDIFLYDGIPYLYRVGLVLVNCVRHLLLQAETEEAALGHLVHPPLACLPSATELLSLAANVKLRDDDVRKQRVKMEQQLKKTTLVRPPNGISNVQTATISLPKT